VSWQAKALNMPGDVRRIIIGGYSWRKKKGRDNFIASVRESMLTGNITRERVQKFAK
jgi:hypothetical protein